MESQLLPFHTFLDKEIAAGFAEKISAAGIPCELSSPPTMLDSNYIGAAADPIFTVKLRSADFEKAHEALNAYYKDLAATVEEGYYLFNFSDQELLDIIYKPDEWNHLDYQLALKILEERGLKPDTPTIERLNQNRISELSKPETNNLGLILLGYILLLGTAFAARSLLWGEPSYFPFFSIFSLFIGTHLSRLKKVLPDGNTVYAFDKNSREHGKAMTTTSIILILFGLFALLFGNDDY